MKNKVKCLIIIGLFIGCAGCAAMHEMSSFGVIEEKTATFDNSTIITMEPDLYYDIPGAIGARWSSAYPDKVVLILKAAGSTRGPSSSLYTNFTGLDINIDGKIKSYKTTGYTEYSDSGYMEVTQTIYTKSLSQVVIPLSVLKAMLTAEDCRLRIHTSSGYLDTMFSKTKRSDGIIRTAIVRMREFMKRVEAKL